jgi:hypothetical protein
MWINGTLADEPQIRETLDQRRTDGGAFADEDQSFCIAQAMTERLDVLHMIIKNCDLMSGKFGKTWQSSDGIEIVIENCNFHSAASRIDVR